MPLSIMSIDFFSIFKTAVKGESGFFQMEINSMQKNNISVLQKKNKKNV